ncbi:MAG TPA: FCD domain-containing protein [Pseudonocardia sp.]|nr:FCD domain-containing protein [Pseudonocardia sp.]
MRDSGGRAAVFAPLDVGRRADAVLRRLSEGIRLGLLRPGEQLPSESELAESFGVAPVTVREALTALREQQLVVTRRGRTGGSFVRDVPAEPADLLLERLREIAPSQLRDLADHYVAVFGHSAQLAAERAGGADVRLLTEDVAELRRAVEVDADVDAGRRAEWRFHVDVAAAAQSPRLTRTVMGLQNEVGPLLWLAATTDTARAEVLARVQGILDAVRTCDAQRARSAATAHVYAALARASVVQLTLLAEDEDAPW